MHSNIVLAATLLASVVSADNFMVHEQRKRSFLEARATATSGSDSGLSADCATAVMSVYTNIPTPPAEIIKDLTEHPQTNPCSFSTPASLSKQYASYSSEIMSWYSGHSKEIDNLTSECPALTKYATMVPVCSTAVAGTDAKSTGSSSSGSSSGSSDSSGSSSDSSSTASGSTAKSTDAGKSDATRTTGMAAVAMAAAGFVVALL